MSVTIELYETGEQAREATAFNQRMRACGQNVFLLTEYPPGMEPDDAAIRNRYYVARDAGSVRGGLLLATYPAWFGAATEVDVVNCREPLSEGIIDPAYRLLGLRLLKFMEQQGPRLFALGMGSEQNAFPRFLKAAKWRLSPVPFLFRVARAGAFLREVRLLQTSPARRLLARLGAATGAGQLGFTALQFRAAGAALASRGMTVTPVAEWGSWVDGLWERCRAEISFSVRRDLRTVRELYPLDGRSRGFCVSRNGQPVGWVAAQLSQMKDHKYFGNLRVATLLDGMALPDAMREVVSQVSGALVQEGAELLVTNQSHTAWVRAFRSAGYLAGPSNYILALSKQLAAEIAEQPEGLARMHFTRGDGDGRGHL